MINRILIVLLLITSTISFSTNKCAVKASPSVGPTHILYLLNSGNYLYSGSLKQLSISHEGSVSYNNRLYNDLRPNVMKDVAVYGSKVYLISSNTIDVLNSKTGRLIKKIPFSGEHMWCYRDKAFISGSFGAIAVLDTFGLDIKKQINTGSSDDPISMTVANGKLYVAISGLPFGADRVSIIDLKTLQLIKTIDFMPGPMSIKSDADGNVILISPSETLTNIFLHPGGLNLINSKTDSVMFISPMRPLTTDDSTLPSAVYGRRLYYFDEAHSLVCYDLISHRATHLISNGLLFNHPSCITIDSSTGEIFITDVKSGDENGMLYAFSKNGKLKSVTDTEINPIQVVISNN